MSKKLITAIKKGDFQEVVNLIENNPKYLNHAIFEAVDVGNVNIVKLLLEKGADVNLQVGDDDATLLYIATEKGRKDMVQLLLENGANVDKPANVFINGTYVERSPLSLAVIKLMQGWVPALYSSLFHYRDTIELLVKHGANIHKKDKNYISPLEIAESNPEIKAFLIEIDRQNKLIMLSSIYEDRKKGLGQYFDAESKELVYNFLGGKKRKSTKKQNSSKNKKKQSKKSDKGDSASLFYV
jgi:ankyrin repeat protein